MKERNIRNNDLYYNTHICKYYNYSFEYRRTEATKAKIKLNASRTGPPKGTQPWNKGLTKETNENVLKFATTLKGHTISNETKQKISKSLKGRKTNKCYTKGWKFKFMNDGCNNTMIKQSEVDEYISKG